jgi:putative hydrolase of the HAD superfamily
LTVLLVTDADNTLWDTDAVYAKGQLTLLEHTEAALQCKAHVADRLSFVREVDQQLAALHGYDLGYRPELLALGIAEALSGASPSEAARRAVQGPGRHAGIRAETLGETFSDFVRHHVPDLRPGVEQAVPELHDRDVLIVAATESSAKRCQVLLDYHGLGRYVAAVVAGRKTERLFAKIAAEHGDPSPRFIAGDQLDRDIAPGKAAGYYTIYFPGGFRPSWEEHAAVYPDSTISSFAEVWPIVARVISTQAEPDVSAGVSEGE